MAAGRTTRQTFDLARGDRVRVRASFESFGSRFEAGEILRYDGTHFSVYDGTDVYSFTRADGTSLQWNVREPEYNVWDDWRAQFERV